MRRIISKKIENKKQRRNQLIIGGILILIMVLSIVGYSFNNQQNKEEKIIYNNIEFMKEENFWYANIGDFQFSFRYNPEETGENNYQLNKLNVYSGDPLYLYAENSEAGIEIYRNLFYYNQISQRIQYACIEGEKCEGDYPMKNCEDNFIIIKESDDEEIIQDNNCVFIKGKNENLIKLTDSFLYKIIGVQ